MIMQWLEWEVKQGRSGDAFKLFKWYRDRGDPARQTKAYYKRIGVGHKIALQLEFESLAELEKFWAELWATPQEEEPPVKLEDVTIQWDSREVWDVLD